MWGLTAFAGTWVAGIIGRRIPSVVLGILVLAALGFNLSMLPYATWFKVVMPVGALAGLVLGTMSGCGLQSKDPSRK
jgi:ABC-type dipeptide/oligopeptide/nickel transport system permease component